MLMVGAWSGGLRQYSVHAFLNNLCLAVSIKQMVDLQFREHLKGQI